MQSWINISQIYIQSGNIKYGDKKTHYFSPPWHSAGPMDHLIHPCPCVTPIMIVYIYLSLQGPGIYTHGATILCNAVRCLVARYAKDALDTRYIFSTVCLHLSVLVAMLVGCDQSSYFLKSRHLSLELLCTGKHYFPDKRGIGCGCSPVSLFVSSQRLVCRSMMLVTISSGQCHHYQLYHCWPPAPAPR